MPELFSVFNQFPELAVIFSTRADGDMKLRNIDEAGVARRGAFFKQNGIQAGSVIGVEAVHGADVIRVGQREAGAAMKHVDGLFTAEPGIFLSVTAADCLALYFYDPVDKMVALVHAGWRGLARGIIAKTLRQFEFPERVRVGVSPFIQACHFEVGADVLDMFSAHPEAITEREGKTFLDLGIVAWRQLLEGGVKSEYTEVSSQCTACLKDVYFSYRRDGEPLQVMVAVLGMKNN